uniref:BHLH domain-containing protein n=1 Tax=Parastrongyloides trichosuri TaxID=131310 RepID=A0A0N4ZG72_PARTI
MISDSIKSTNYEYFHNNNPTLDGGNFNASYVKPDELDALMNKDNLLNVLQPEGLKEINNIVDSIKNDELNMYSNNTLMEIPLSSESGGNNNFQNFKDYRNQYSEGQSLQQLPPIECAFTNYYNTSNSVNHERNFYMNETNGYREGNLFEYTPSNMKINSNGYQAQTFSPFLQGPPDFYTHNNYNYKNDGFSPQNNTNMSSPLSFSSFSSDSLDQQNIDYTSINSSPMSNESLYHSANSWPTSQSSLSINGITRNSVENFENINIDNTTNNNHGNEINMTSNLCLDEENNIDDMYGDNSDDKIENLIREKPMKLRRSEYLFSKKNIKRNDLYTEDFGEDDEDNDMDDDEDEKMEDNENEKNDKRSKSNRSSGKKDGKDINNEFKRPKTERRKAHNLIEKKYRCSINVQINQLKEMVAKKDEKLSKSATLKKAVDKLHWLMEENEQLYSEIDVLKKTLKKVYESNKKLRNNMIDKKYIHKSPSNSDYFSGSDTASPPINNENNLRRYNYSQMQPPTLINKFGIPIPEVSLNKTRKQMKKVMDNKSRVSLCIFMFCMIIFNPISIFSSTTNLNESSIDRESHFDITKNFTSTNILAFSHRIINEINNQTVLKGVEMAAMVNETANKARHWYQNNIMKNTYIWGMNAVIIISILYKLLVSGEPVTDYNSPYWDSFIRFKKSASTAISKGNYERAEKYLLSGLDMLGRPIPNRGFDELLTVFWQIIRHLLNSVWVGRYFSRRKRSPTQLRDAVCKSHAATALVYHQLHQLHLIREDSKTGNNLRGLNLVLSAVNLSESAGISNDRLTHAQRADIYINAAIRARLSLPRYIGNLIGKYFMRRARRHVKKASSKNEKFMSLNWVFTSQGKKFLSDITKVHNIIKNVNFDSSFKTYFCNNYSKESMKPLNHLTIAFKADLIEQLVDKYQITKKSSTNSNLFNISEIIQLLLSISSCPHDHAHTNSIDCNDASLCDWNTIFDNFEFSDEVASWWAHLLSAALYWKSGNKIKAQSHYAVVIKAPKEMKDCGYTFATVLAFCTKKMSIDDSFNPQFSEATIYYCMKGIDYINEELRKNSSLTFVDDSFKRIFDKTRFITLEWYLSCLLGVWYSKLRLNSPFWNQPIRHNTLVGVYKTLLNIYNNFRANYHDEDNGLLMKYEFYKFCCYLMEAETQESIAVTYGNFLDKFKAFYNQSSISNLPSLLHFLKYFVTQEKVHLSSFLQYHTNVHFKIIKKLKDELKHISFTDDVSLYTKKNF